MYILLYVYVYIYVCMAALTLCFERLASLTPLAYVLGPRPSSLLLNQFRDQ